MNNVVTALGNPILNNELKRFNEINILLNDLQYKEAIIELLEKKNKNKLFNIKWKFTRRNKNRKISWNNKGKRKKIKNYIN